MESIYQKTSKRLDEKVGDLKWIDLDSGQLDYREYRASIDFPATLIDIAYPSCDDMGHSGRQDCNVTVTIRLVSMVFDETNIAAPEDVREKGLGQFRLIDQIQKALQLWQPDDDNMDVFRRRSITKEKREDGLTVHRIVYSTSYYDDNSAAEELTKIEPDINIQTK